MSGVFRLHRSLLASSIDFAGMFPPASLSFERTLAVAARWRSRAAFPWLLRRVVLPLQELMRVDDELLFSCGAGGSAWLFTVLVSDPLVEGVREVSRFNENQYHAAIQKRAVSVEWKTSLGALIDETWFRDLRSLPVRHLLPLTLYVEALDVEETVEIGRLLKRLQANPAVDFGIKIRTGGERLPSSGQLALAIAAAVENGLQFKATQGLHEAISHGSAFGFINLFVALALKSARNISEPGLRACLEEQDPRAFSFSNEGIFWSGNGVSLSDIEMARRIHGAAFGSCSLDDPQESLQKYGEVSE